MLFIFCRGHYFYPTQVQHFHLHISFVSHLFISYSLFMSPLHLIFSLLLLASFQATIPRLPGRISFSLASVDTPHIALKTKTTASESSSSCPFVSFLLSISTPHTFEPGIAKSHGGRRPSWQLVAPLVWEDNEFPQARDGALTVCVCVRRLKVTACEAFFVI